ncbi:hypothetical protein [Streptomyces sp. NPDC048411]|uniref:hypothetical protein n=1 Tax=Streptomyces sp. NPDC048411 TaxID=3157206 RepID=UPI003452D6CE
MATENGDVGLGPAKRSSLLAMLLRPNTAVNVTQLMDALWEDTTPFIWTKTAQEILNSLARFCRRISGAGH